MKKVLYSLIVFSILTAPLAMFAVGQGGQTFPNPFGSGITTLPKFIEEITNNVILPVGAVVVVIMIIYAGFRFVTAQGNENNITDAKRAFMYAVIGALILLGSWVIANSIRGTICLLYDDPPAGLECGN